MMVLFAHSKLGHRALKMCGLNERALQQVPGCDIAMAHLSTCYNSTKTVLAQNAPFVKLDDVEAAIREVQIEPSVEERLERIETTLKMAYARLESMPQESTHTHTA